MIPSPTQYWPLNNSLISKINSDYNLTMSGSLSWIKGPFGYQNTALTGFEDDSSGFQNNACLISDYYGFNPGNSKAMWIKTNITDHYQPLVSFNWADGFLLDQASSMWFISSNTSETGQGCMRFQITYVNSFEMIFLSDDIISTLEFPSDNRWHLCGINIDESNNIRFFIDKTQSDIYTLQSEYPMLSSSYAAIGADQFIQGGYFSGLIGSIRDYGGIDLTIDDMKHLYDQDVQNHTLFFGL